MELNTKYRVDPSAGHGIGLPRHHISIVQVTPSRGPQQSMGLSETVLILKLVSIFYHQGSDSYGPYTRQPSSYDGIKALQ